MKLLIIILIILTTNSLIYGNNFSWWSKLKQIQPHYSTQTDVENILGKPENTNNDGLSANYRIGENRLSIDYSDGKCNTSDREEWDIPNWVVLRYSFSIFEHPYPIVNKFAKFAKFDLKSFTIKTYDDPNESDTPSMITHDYDNEESGIFLEGFKWGFQDKNGKVRTKKTVHLRGIMAFGPEYSKYPKCN